MTDSQPKGQMVEILVKTKVEQVVENKVEIGPNHVGKITGR